MSHEGVCGSSRRDNRCRGLEADGQGLEQRPVGRGAGCGVREWPCTASRQKRLGWGGVLSRGGTWPVSGGCMEWTQEARDRGREDSAEAAAPARPLGRTEPGDGVVK